MNFQRIAIGLIVLVGRYALRPLLRLVGGDIAAFRVLEYGGAGLDALSVEGLQVMTGLAMFAGAVTAIVPPGSGRAGAQPPGGIGHVKADRGHGRFAASAVGQLTSWPTDRGFP